MIGQFGGACVLHGPFGDSPMRHVYFVLAISPNLVVAVAASVKWKGYDEPAEHGSSRYDFVSLDEGGLIGSSSTAA